MPAALNRVIRSYESQSAIGSLKIPNDRAAVFLGAILFPLSRGLQPARLMNCLEPPDGVYRLRAPARAIIEPRTTSRSRHSPSGVSNVEIFAGQRMDRSQACPLVRTDARLLPCIRNAGASGAPTCPASAQAEACGSVGRIHRASRMRARSNRSRARANQLWARLS